MVRTIAPSPALLSAPDFDEAQWGPRDQLYKQVLAKARYHTATDSIVGRTRTAAEITQWQT